MIAHPGMSALEKSPYTDTHPLVDTGNMVIGLSPASQTTLKDRDLMDTRTFGERNAHIDAIWCPKCFRKSRPLMGPRYRVLKSSFVLLGRNRNWLWGSIANGLGSETESEAEKHVIAMDR